MKKNYHNKYRTKKYLVSLAFNPEEGLPTYKKLEAMSNKELEEATKGALYYINTQRTKMKDTWSPSLDYTMKQIYKRTQPIKTLKKDKNGNEYTSISTDITQKIKDYRSWVKYDKNGEITPATRKKMQAIVEFVVAYTGAEYNTPGKARAFIEEQMEILEEISPEYTDENNETIKPQWDLQDLKDFWEIYDSNRNMLEQYGSDEGQLLLAKYYSKNRFKNGMTKEALKSSVAAAFTDSEGKILKQYKEGFREEDFDVYSGQKGIGRKVKKWKGSTI